MPDDSAGGRLPEDAFCLLCDWPTEQQRAAFIRTQRVAASKPNLDFARADTLEAPHLQATEADLHRYIEASSRHYQLEHDGVQIPPTKITEELTALAQLLRDKCALFDLPAPKHPLPITLPAQRNRLDHAPHQDGANKLAFLQDRLDAVCQAGVQGLPNNAVLGFVCSVLALECGLLNLHEHRALLRCLGKPIHATGDWWHLDLQLTDGRSDKLELRRVRLHALPLAALIATRYKLRAMPGFSFEDLAALDDTRLNQKMNGCFRALCKALGLPKSDRPKSFSTFLAWVAAPLRVTGMPLLEAYATRDVISHCVPLDVFRRWEGYAAVGGAAPDQSAAGQDDIDLSSATGGASKQQLDDVRRIFRKSALGRRQRAAAIQSLIDSWPVPPDENLRCLIEFGLATEAGYVPGFRHQKAISISHLLRVIGPPWLSVTEGLALNALSQADIEAVCEEVLDQQSAPGARRRIAPGLRLFLAFLQSEGYLVGLDLPEIPRALGLLAVSANAATPIELRDAVKVMESASAFATEPERLAAATMTDIAGNCGPRRNEILHLRGGDLHLSGRQVALIRPNTARDLKAAGSMRWLLLELASRSARDQLRRFAQGCGTNDPIISAALGATQAVYEWRFFPSMNRALKQALADNTFHFHHLRHGAATWTLVSLLADALDLQRYASRSPYLAEPINNRRKTMRHLLANLGPSGKGLHAVSLMLGHASPGTTLEHYIHSMDLLLHAHFDSSARDGQAKRVSGLLNGLRPTPHRTVQTWLGKGAEHAGRGIEKRFPEEFARDDTKLEKRRHIAEAASGQTTLFQLLERHWLRLRREQDRRERDPGGEHRPPSEPLARMIDALSHVHDITTDKRGSHVLTHGLKQGYSISLPPPLRGEHARGTAIRVSQMLEDAFRADFQRTRDAIAVWNEHTSRDRSFFRLNADTEGAMQWLLDSGCLSAAWYEWGDKFLNPIARSDEYAERVRRPKHATHFRLSRPKAEPGAPRTERSAVWWVQSMAYALVRGGVL